MAGSGASGPVLGDDDAVYCRDLVRLHDRDRYLCALFAPARHRPAILALYAFDVEIRRIAATVSEPMAGEIRLQWWHDLLAAEDRDAAAGHPVGRALEAAIGGYGLPRQPLLDLIEARTFDLYTDPMPGLTELEAYLGHTVSAVMQLAAIVLAEGRDPRTAEAAGHGGVAVGLARLLRGLAAQAARGQVYLPVDLLARHGLAPADLLGEGDAGRVRAAVSELCAHGMHHLDRFHRALAAVQPGGQLAAAFVEAGTVRGDLQASARLRGDPRRSAPGTAPWRRQWRIWRMARRLG